MSGRRRPATGTKGAKPAKAATSGPSARGAKGAARSRGQGPTGRSPRPRRRLAVGMAGAILLVAFLLVGVFPTRDWLAQRDETRQRQDELARSDAERIRLERRIEELQTPEEIESIAREEYGMALPGEEVFRMLPLPVPAVDLPDTWPFAGADDWLNR